MKNNLKKLGIAMLMTGLVSVGLAQDQTAAEKTATDETKQLSQAEMFKALSLTSKAFRNASKAIEPALVTIESYGGVNAVQGRIGGIRKQGEGNTTGVMISPDGLVITSTFNFIKRPPIITVITSDGERRYAELLGRDDTRKLCLLKIKDVKDMPVPEIVDPESLKIGQWALSVGVGYGDTNPAVSMGIISAKNRIGGRAIQTDANISPASYGGALIDIDGRLLGICVPMNPQRQAVGAGVEWYDSGIGFAIPLHGLEGLIKRLERGAELAPGFLGVQAMKHPDVVGLWIEKVVPDSAAAKAGLEREDVIRELNGEKVSDMMKFKQVISRHDAGTEVELTYLPDGADEEKTIKVTLTAPPKPEGETEQLEPPKIR